MEKEKIRTLRNTSRPSYGPTRKHKKYTYYSCTIQFKDSRVETKSAFTHQRRATVQFKAPKINAANQTATVFVTGVGGTVFSRKDIRYITKTNRAVSACDTIRGTSSKRERKQELEFPPSGSTTEPSKYTIDQRQSTKRVLHCRRCVRGRLLVRLLPSRQKSQGSEEDRVRFYRVVAMVYGRLLHGFSFLGMHVFMVIFGIYGHASFCGHG